MSKLLTSILLLTADDKQDKITYLFDIYASHNQHNPGIAQPINQPKTLKRAHLRQMLDHLYFAVIYAIPNLAYHLAGFGFGTEKCERVMEHKLVMQKKVYSDKSNMLRTILNALSVSGSQFLTEAEFRQAMLRYRLIDRRELRSRLVPIIAKTESQILFRERKELIVRTKSDSYTYRRIANLANYYFDEAIDERAELKKHIRFAFYSEPTELVI
jgi:hypothetical protein